MMSLNFAIHHFNDSHDYEYINNDYLLSFD